MSNSYTILAAPIEHATEQKNSDFLTFLHPVDSREHAIQWIEHYRVRYNDANHVCWAFVIGDTRQPQTQAFNDDGEPSGTAGKPMLHVLLGRELGNTLAVVVRYFGGVKLGAGGLVRAYSAAVSEAAALAQFQTISPSSELTLSIDFAREARIRQLIQHYQGQLKATHYSNNVCLHLSLPNDQLAAFEQQVSNETAGNAIIRPAVTV